MNRRRLAVRLSLLVALAGLVPIAIVGGSAVELLRRRSERAALEGLATVADQTAERISGFLAHQEELIRAVAAVATGEDVERRLAELVLDAPSIGHARVVGPSAGPEETAGQGALTGAQVARALAGETVAGGLYIAPGSTPAMDVCVPARALEDRAICAQLDLLELWRFVQRIRVGESGYAVAFDEQGRVLASGAGALRAAILTGEPVPQSAAAKAAMAAPEDAPDRYQGPAGEPVLAAWARLPQRPWVVVVEQPVAEATQTARAAQWILLAVLLLALVLSVAVGVIQSQRVMADLEVEERWRTAGRIAAGVTHDLGHRLRILQQTAGLAEANQPAFLPQIADNLRSEVRTLEKFVTDFSDLSRDTRKLEALPLELGSFLESMKRPAQAHADAAGVAVTVEKPPSAVWVKADRYLLERAVLNLVSNAIEASPRGAVVTLQAEAEDGQVDLSVTDRGAGIPADRLPSLFSAFVSTKRTGAHLGMGLANVKRIVDAHGGRVEVQSEEGQGTRFTLRLPATAPPAAEGEGAPPAPPTRVA